MNSENFLNFFSLRQVYRLLPEFYIKSSRRLSCMSQFLMEDSQYDN